MATSRAHLTALPKGFILVRILQLVLAITLVALAIVQMVYRGSIASLIIAISAALSTIILTWLISATYCAPKAYNYWAILAFEIFQFLLWLDAAAFAILLAILRDDDDDYCYSLWNSSTRTYRTYCRSTSATQRAAQKIGYATAAMSGALAILFLVSMIVVSVFISRHRRAGGCSDLHRAEGAHKAMHGKEGALAAAQGSAPMMVGAVPVAGVPQETASDAEIWEQNAQLQRQFEELQREHQALQERTGELPTSQARPGTAV